MCELCEHYEGLRLIGSAGDFSHYCRAFEEGMYTPIKAIKICPKKK